MRSIALRNYSETETGYSVFLGNSTFHKFKSKRAAKKFLADTNRFLTVQLIELNEIYILAFSQYRYSWFIFRNIKTGNRTNYTRHETKIKYSLESTSEMFDRVHGSFGGTNDNAFAFINTLKICYFLLEAIEGLITINKIRNNTVIYHTLFTYQERLKLISERIKEYGNKKAPVETGAVNQN